MKLIHTDLKLENILLLNSDWQVRTLPLSPALFLSAPSSCHALPDATPAHCPALTWAALRSTTDTPHMGGRGS
eukprot:3352869-Rhodomonas_salina.3